MSCGCWQGRVDYQLQNRVENLADVSTRCSGLLLLWSKRQQGFQPCFEAGIRELPFLMPEPAEKPLLQEWISELANIAEKTGKDGKQRWTCIRQLQMTHAGRRPTRPTAMWKENGEVTRSPEKVKQRWHDQFSAMVACWRARCPEAGVTVRYKHDRKLVQLNHI